MPRSSENPPRPKNKKGTLDEVPEQFTPEQAAELDARTEETDALLNALASEISHSTAEGDEKVLRKHAADMGREYYIADIKKAKSVPGHEAYLAGKEAEKEREAALKSAVKERLAKRAEETQAYDEQVAQKEAEIAGLRERLKDPKEKPKELFASIEELKEEIASLRKSQSEQFFGKGRTKEKAVRQEASEQEDIIVEVPDRVTDTGRFGVYATDPIREPGTPKEVRESLSALASESFNTYQARMSEALGESDSEPVREAAPAATDYQNDEAGAFFGISDIDGEPRAQAAAAGSAPAAPGSAAPDSAAAMPAPAVEQPRPRGPKKGRKIEGYHATEFGDPDAGQRVLDEFANMPGDPIPSAGGRKKKPAAYAPTSFGGTTAASPVSAGIPGATAPRRSKSSGIGPFFFGSWRRKLASGLGLSAGAGLAAWLFGSMGDGKDTKVPAPQPKPAAAERPIEKAAKAAAPRTSADKPPAAAIPQPAVPSPETPPPATAVWAEPPSAPQEQQPVNPVMPMRPKESEELVPEEPDQGKDETTMPDTATPPAEQVPERERPPVLVEKKGTIASLVEEYPVAALYRNEQGILAFGGTPEERHALAEAYVKEHPGAVIRYFKADTNASGISVTEVYAENGRPAYQMTEANRPELAPPKPTDVVTRLAQTG